MLFYNQVIFIVRTSNYSELTSEISRFLKDLCSSQLWRIYCPAYQGQLQLLTAVRTLVCKECDSKPLIPGQGCGMKAGCRRGLARGLIPLKKSSHSEWQTNQLLAYHAFSGVSVHQAWDSRSGMPVNGWCECWSICTTQSQKAYPPYYDHLHREEKLGYSCKWLSSEGNRGSNMPDRPSS